MLLDNNVAEAGLKTGCLNLLNQNLSSYFGSDFILVSVFTFFTLRFFLGILAINKNYKFPKTINWSSGEIGQVALLTMLLRGVTTV